MTQSDHMVPRPLFHFTSDKNWINDPNGMVYFEGEYHLFYQHNPHGDTWGHMSWGHAVSRDLITWEQLPLAIPEASEYAIYSGSVVMDWNNSSGFGVDGQPPMVAIYTAHATHHNLQSQHIAFSMDGGRHWTTYANNPILDVGEADFRDPKVFWHESTQRWIMIVSFAVRRHVSFYASTDLKQWYHLSDFGPVGAVEGIWECPDLFPLPVENQSGQSYWVLLLNINPGHPAGGSGCQYFVGHFDGTRFIQLTDETLWLDYGADFYAAVSWSDIPADDGRRIILGWMNNWIYAGKTPTSPWRGMMSIPRTLLLRETDRGPRLLQQPVRELTAYRVKGKQKRFHGPFPQAVEWLNDGRDHGLVIDAVFSFTGVKPGMRFSILLETGRDHVVAITCDASAGHVSLDRSQSGCVSFSEVFTGVHKAPLRLESGSIEIRLLVDTCSLELFAQGGEIVLSDQFFARSDERAFRLVCEGQAPAITTIELNPMIGGHL